MMGNGGGVIAKGGCEEIGTFDLLLGGDLRRGGIDSEGDGEEIPRRWR